VARYAPESAALIAPIADRAGYHGRVRLILLVSLFALPAAAEGVVLLFPAVGTPKQVTVSGRVFTEEPGKGSSTVSKNLRALLVPNWANAEVEVRFEGKSANVKSNAEGAFEATFDGDFKPGAHDVEAHVKGAAVGKAFADVVSPDAPFFVVVDFDDTVAVTEVLHKSKLLRHALAQDADTQPVVEGMPQMMRCLREDKKERPVFALVSGSPVQFVPRVAKFMALHDFPPFGLYLRDIGPTTLSDYKQPIIRQLMKSVPNPVVMVGDSGEHDPEVYSQMRGEFPGRVKLVAIHDVGRDEDKNRFKDMVLFKQPKDAMPEFVKQGLVAQSCVDGAFK
jgi:phosphatidate phosphatase APP1